MIGNAPSAAAKRLLDFIRGYEAPHGYDTVFGNRMAQMRKPITQMTVDEVIADGPRRTKQFGSSAAGGLQFMTATLQGLKGSGKVRGGEVMSPDVQDRLGYELLLGRGFSRFLAGSLGVTGFGLALAKEWASFPVLEDCQGAHRRVSRGQSYYAGDGLNKALVSADAVEDMLEGLQDAPMVVAARAATIQPAAQPTSLWSRLKVVFGPHADPSHAVPVITGSKGDPTIFYVQKTLREKAYYTKGFLDGIDGGLTQGAVAQARKDNGMGDGGIDAEFLTKLPTFPQRPVSTERASVTVSQAAAHVPAVFQPNSLLAKAGLTLVAGGGAGSFLDKASSTIDTVNTVGGRVSGYLDTAETWGGYVERVVSFGLAHWHVIAILGGAYLVFRAVVGIADGVAKVRQAFF